MNWTNQRRHSLLTLLILAAPIIGSDSFSLSSIRCRVLPKVSSVKNKRSSSPSCFGGAICGTADDDAGGSTPSNAELKADLLKRIETLRAIKERDGDFSIDFGVKGGEIDKKSRAPQKVDYYSISEDAGKAADAVMETADKLATQNPTEEATAYLGDKENGNQSPLDGEWKLLFTTAADATFSKNSTRGDAKAKNVVDAKRGRITNVIDFALTENGTVPLLKQLNVVIGAKPASNNRVELQFRYAKAVLTKFFWWKKQWSLYIPVPAPFITRLIVFFSRIFRFGRNTEKKVPPKAYFDVLYLDEDLRIHKTGEDNLFVQAKSGWEEARPFFA